MPSFDTYLSRGDDEIAVTVHYSPSAGGGIEEGMPGRRCTYIDLDSVKDTDGKDVVTTDAQNEALRSEASDHLNRY